MSTRLLLAGLALALLAPSARQSAADDERKAEKIAPADLALEIHVLRVLYYLKATPEQAQALLKLAKVTAGKAKKRVPGKVSDEYHRLLEEVHEALAEDDEERIEPLDEKLEELTIRESPELDDEVDITDAARKRAPSVLKQFRAHQLATFIGLHADQIPEPQELLQEALDKVRGWELSEWQVKRDALGDQMAMLVGGVDRAKSDKAREAAIELLARARTLKEEDFAAKRAELVREAGRITGQVGPMDVLRNFAEHALAEMLSNPRLEAALRARAKVN